MPPGTETPCHQAAAPATCHLPKARTAPASCSLGRRRQKVKSCSLVAARCCLMLSWSTRHARVDAVPDANPIQNAQIPTKFQRKFIKNSLLLEKNPNVFPTRILVHSNTRTHAWILRTYSIKVLQEIRNFQDIQEKIFQTVLENKSRFKMETSLIYM